MSAMRANHPRRRLRISRVSYICPGPCVFVSSLAHCVLNPLLAFGNGVTNTEKSSVDLELASVKVTGASFAAAMVSA